MSDSDDDFNPMDNASAMSLPEDLAVLSAATDADPRGFDGWVALLMAAEQTVRINVYLILDFEILTVRKHLTDVYLFMIGEHRTCAILL